MSKPEFLVLRDYLRQNCLNEFEEQSEPMLLPINSITEVIPGLDPQQTLIRSSAGNLIVNLSFNEFLNFLKELHLWKPIVMEVPVNN